MTEQKNATAQRKIDGYRAAAGAFPAVRRVVESYNGKCYNKRLTEALREAIGETGSIYAEKNGNRLSINYSPRGVNAWHLVASVKLADALPDGKRINAAAIVDSMRETRAGLLRRAYEIEETGRNVETIRTQLDAIERELAAVMEPISYEARDLYGLRFSSRYTY